MKNNKQMRVNKLPSERFNLFERLFKLEKRISVGYSEDNWGAIGYEIMELSKCLSPQSRKILGAAWSMFYVYQDLDWLKSQFKLINKIL